MSAALTPQSGRHGNVSYPVDLGEIVQAPGIEASQRIARAHLLPAEEQASLVLPVSAGPATITPLTRFLGPLLTVANPAWTANAIPAMRALQKALVEHALTLPQDDRADCMGAIAAVERAVQLRLRLQQMRMDDADMDIQPAKPIKAGEA